MNSTRTHTESKEPVKKKKGLWSFYNKKLILLNQTFKKNKFLAFLRLNYQKEMHERDFNHFQYQKSLKKQNYIVFVATNNTT